MQREIYKDVKKVISSFGRSEWQQSTNLCVYVTITWLSQYSKIYKDLDSFSSGDVI